jgi:hypothetical protein
MPTSTEPSFISASSSQLGQLDQSLGANRSCFAHSRDQTEQRMRRSDKSAEVGMLSKAFGALRQLGNFLSYAGTAILLSDFIAWDEDGAIVRHYLEPGDHSKAEARH